jgi:hypothetical protein
MSAADVSQNRLGRALGSAPEASSLELPSEQQKQQMQAIVNGLQPLAIQDKTNRAIILLKEHRPQTKTCGCADIQRLQVARLATERAGAPKRRSKPKR